METWSNLPKLASLDSTNSKTKTPEKIGPNNTLKHSKTLSPGKARAYSNTTRRRTASPQPPPFNPLKKLPRVLRGKKQLGEHSWGAEQVTGVGVSCRPKSGGRGGRCRTS